MSAPVDVVILTWNDGELLERAIASALGSDDVAVSVVVVDNGSEPPAVVPDDERVRLVRNTANRGVAAGRNQGARACGGPVLCFLDSDAELRPHSLAAMVVHLLGDPRLGVVVPVFADQSPEASAGRAPTLTTKVARALGRRVDYSAASRQPSDRAWEVEFGIGACQVIRREAFDAVGGLDESFFYGPEDVDFCLRVARAGWRVEQLLGPDVVHPPRRAFRRPLTLSGLRHAWAVARYLVRHRRVR